MIALASSDRKNQNMVETSDGCSIHNSLMLLGTLLIMQNLKNNRMVISYVIRLYKFKCSKKFKFK